MVRYSRNIGLYAQMGLTMSGLALLYLVFLGLLSLYVPSASALALIALAFLTLQYFYSDKLALKGANARVVDESEYPQLHSMVTRLSVQSDLPKPTVAVSSAKMTNAFAAGRNQQNSVVCVTEELLRQLNEEELEGVLAHELAHIKNRDVAVMTIASFFSTIAFFIARYGIYGNTRDGRVFIAIILSFVVWIVSTLLLRALSRYREYSADRGAASITGNPLALASALKTISGVNDSRPSEDMRKHAGMNAFYISPINAGLFASLLSTHPQTEKRINELEDLAAEQYTS